MRTVDNPGGGGVGSLPPGMPNPEWCSRPVMDRIAATDAGSPRGQGHQVTLPGRRRGPGSRQGMCLMPNPQSMHLSYRFTISGSQSLPSMSSESLILPILP